MTTAQRTERGSYKTARRNGRAYKRTSFSRNFGKEGAVFAGLKAADGDCVAVIDCDLQHPPELLEKMYAAWKNGAEVVEAVKASRGKEGIIYKLFAKTFYRMMKNSSAIDLDGASDYKLMDARLSTHSTKCPKG